MRARPDHASVESRLKQLSLLPQTLPPGFGYQPVFLTRAELARLPWKPYQYGEYTAHREIAAYGMEDKGVQGHDPAREPPAFIVPYRDRIASVFGADHARLVVVPFTRYPVGAAIGWHSDAPMYAGVFGFSLLSDCVMDFRLPPREGSGERPTELHVDLDAHGAYTMQGPSRYPWQHRIKAMRSERYSITFRSLRASASWPV